MLQPSRQGKHANALQSRSRKIIAPVGEQARVFHVEHATLKQCGNLNDLHAVQERLHFQDPRDGTLRAFTAEEGYGGLEIESKSVCEAEVTGPETWNELAL